eukprot:CAMPEP_0114507896 /NCGR_PEP_ID=MMETSP0109-20121206/12278_1 /TAXON_ID=29199 /ORGANISM="Chlorarachnion reptans, Strain CCCM449" /LENGTH=203 /DNA_ID=CAMNT_0001686727 /DNA_START=31 /DNA_END=639 /DNA_ORIENTATION=+
MATEEKRPVLYFGVFRINSSTSFEIVARMPAKVEGIAATLETQCTKVLKKLHSRFQEESMKKEWQFEKKDEGYTIHLNNEPKACMNCAFFAVVSEAFEKRPTVMLREFVEKFSREYSPARINESEDGQLTKPTKKMFNEILDKYATNKLEQTRQQIDGIKGQMGKNMRDLIDRGDDLKVIEQKADDLEDAAFGFKKVAEKLKW